MCYKKYTCIYKVGQNSSGSGNIMHATYNILRLYVRDAITETLVFVLEALLKLILIRISHRFSCIRAPFNMLKTY